jgi:hypothetical protein
LRAYERRIEEEKYLIAYNSKKGLARLLESTETRIAHRNGLVIPAKLSHSLEHQGKHAFE